MCYAGLSGDVFCFCTSFFDGGYSGQVERHRSKPRFFLVTSVSLPVMGYRLGMIALFCVGVSFCVFFLIAVLAVLWAGEKMAEPE